MMIITHASVESKLELVWQGKNT